MGYFENRRLRIKAKNEINSAKWDFWSSVNKSGDEPYICGYSLVDGGNNAVEKDLDEYLKVQAEYEALLMRDNLYNQSIRPFKSGKKHYLVLERREKFVEFHTYGSGRSSSAAGAGGLGLSATHLEVSKKEYDEYKKYIDYFKDVMIKNKNSNFGRATRNKVYKHGYEFKSYVKAFDVYVKVLNLRTTGTKDEYERQLVLSGNLTEAEMTPLFDEKEKKYLDNYQEVLNKRNEIVRKIEKMQRGV